MKIKNYNEIMHGQFLARQNAESIWGWGTPAGMLRAKRRGELIANSAGLKPGLRVLEIGCGTGLFTEFFAKYNIDLSAIDISSELIEKAKKRNIIGNVDFIVGPFEELNLNKNFDAIIGSSVLHHLETQQALKKMYNLLKPGGVICFAEPNQLNPQIFFMFKFRSLFPEISPDENPFLKWKLKQLLNKNGFKYIKITPFDWLHPSTPSILIEKIKVMGNFMEKIPGISEFAGSLLIKAYKSNS